MLGWELVSEMFEGVCSNVIWLTKASLRAKIFIYGAKFFFKFSALAFYASIFESKSARLGFDELF